MKIEQIRDTYDAAYANVYNTTFLHDGWTKDSVEFQLGQLATVLDGARNWLDVCCGTGFVLSRFPEVPRAGLDISASMLELALQNNPGCTFVQRNARDPFPEWNDQWQVVSCMWWAYCLSETMSELQQLVARLADWTAPDGSVFVPLCNPNKFDTHNIRIPYVDPRVPGRCMITGITWTWIQESGKRHDDALSPQIDHLMAMFRQHFDDVRIIEGPLDELGEGWKVQDILVARGKRADRESGLIYPPNQRPEPGIREWLLGTSGGALATLSYRTGDLTTARVTIDDRGTMDPWNVQVNKIGFSVERGRSYRLIFRARADQPRSVGVGVSLGHEPWTGLGAYRTVELSADWTDVETHFEASASSDRARIHFDLALELPGVELAWADVLPLETVAD